MTLVEVKGDIGMVTLVSDPTLIHISPDLDGLPQEAGYSLSSLSRILVVDSQLMLYGGTPSCARRRKRGFGTGCGGFMFFQSLT